MKRNNPDMRDKKASSTRAFDPKKVVGLEEKVVGVLEPTDVPSKAQRLRMDRAPKVRLCETEGRTKETEPSPKHLEPSTVESQASSPQPSAAAGHCEAGVGVPGPHDLRRAGDLTFCNKCGRYTTRLTSTGQPVSTKLLASKCAGPLEKPTGQLYRMRSGKNPTTNRFMGPVKRI